MAPLLAAKVWHYWISIALIVPILGITIAVIAGYVAKVLGPKYMKR
jgi:hypothetical protein